MALPLTDGFLLPHLRLLCSEEGQKNITRSLWWAALSGLIKGLSLLSLLGGAVTLASGSTMWGLRFSHWLILLAVLAVTGFVVEYALAMTGYRSAMGLIYHLNHKLGSMISRIPIGWFKADSAGRMSRIVGKELVQMGEVLAHMVYALIKDAAAACVVLVGLWVWDWRLGLCLTVAAPVLYLFLAVSRSLLNRGKQIVEPTNIEVADRLIEYTTHQAALRSSGRSTNFSELDNAREANFQATRKNLWFGIAGNLLSSAFSQVIIISLIFIAAGLALSGVLGLIETIAFIGMSINFISVFEEMISSAIAVEDRRSMILETESVLEAPLLDEVEKSAQYTAPGAVSLHDVHFSYNPGTPVLRGVSFDVTARTMCAIVGPSGSGKTTISRLISRFYDVDSGSVSVGGVNVKDQTTEDLMAQLSIVFQDVYLFDDTLEANIRVGREDATDEQVREAARLAGVNEIVSRLPKGYQTQVGEGGCALSGGERQRVSIARALLKGSPIVLFDEATSALDAENEANLVASVEQLCKTSTVIVIAHKLDTIKNADQVIVLSEDGRVAQHGTHNELIKTNGPYRTFWSQREKAHGWSLI